ncbi:MAG: hypothetical protein AAB702_01835 [Patescibacteria group bacterium]
MKKSLYTFLATSLILGFSIASNATSAFAQCQPIYGGGQTCTSFSFSIRKLVQVPGKAGGNFVNSLSINDAKYSPSNKVNFQVVVTNTGSETIPTITVVDQFPDFLGFVSGPGSFDSNNKTLTFTVTNLGAGQSTTPFIIIGKIADEKSLPTDQGIICPLNQATGTDSNGLINSSSSQFCVQKGVLGAAVPQVFEAPKIVSTPATGPEMLPLMALIPGGLAGLILRKKSYKSGFKGGEK